MLKEIEKLNRRIHSLEIKIAEIQAGCAHFNSDIQLKSNTGNYDPSADCDWVEVNCLDCGKFISFDFETNKEEYRFWSLKKK